MQDSAGRTHGARVPIHERFRVYVDERGILRTDHELRLYRALALRLHYRLEKGNASPLARERHHSGPGAS